MLFANEIPGGQMKSIELKHETTTKKNCIFRTPQLHKSRLINVPLLTENSETKFPKHKRVVG